MGLAFFLASARDVACACVSCWIPPVS